jgi:hypothetical protein
VSVGPLVVVAGLQDPGNLGTILRSAEAFGAAGVILGEGTVSPFNLLCEDRRDYFPAACLARSWRMFSQAPGERCVLRRLLVA